MHDETSAPAADATFQALREEFLEDAAEDLKNLLSYLNEGIAGSRPVDEVLHAARRVAVMLVGGANGFELPLVGVAAQRFDDYTASLAPDEAQGLNGLVSYTETLLDLLDAPDENEETAAHLVRRLPASGATLGRDFLRAAGGGFWLKQTLRHTPPASTRRFDG